MECHCNKDYLCSFKSCGFIGCKHKIEHHKKKHKGHLLYYIPDLLGFLSKLIDS